MINLHIPFFQPVITQQGERQVLTATIGSVEHQMKFHQSRIIQKEGNSYQAGSLCHSCLKTKQVKYCALEYFGLFLHGNVCVIGIASTSFIQAG